jgi:perosamine synthetase
MKYIPYGRQKLDRSDINSVVKALRSDWITQGPKILEFEKKICKYTGAKYAVVVSSGTAALHIACLAAGIGEGDEVITSPITFVASANSVLYCGGKPVFADIQEDTINIDPCEVERKITKRTRAIIPVDFAGHPVEAEQIQKIARTNGLFVIEDASHALGAEYRNNKVGSCKFSDITTFSFHPVKHITTGEGGAITTNRRDLYEKFVMLRNHGITKDRKKLTNYDGPWSYEQHYLGFNYRITDIQCALGISQLNKLDEFLIKRRKIASIYNKDLASLGKILLPVERPYVKSSWHLYYIRLKNREERKVVFQKLQRAGMGVQVHYIPVHLQPYYRKTFGYKEGDFKLAENYYRQTISIPLYPAMREEEIFYVTKTLKRIFK